MKKTITFNQPVTDKQLGFGLFALLKSKGFGQKRELNPAEPFIVVDFQNNEFSSSATAIGTAINIPANYAELI